MADDKPKTKRATRKPAAKKPAAKKPAAKKASPKPKAAPKPPAKKTPIVERVLDVLPAPLDPKLLGREARRAVLAFAEVSGMDGAAKRRAAVERVALMVDAALVWPMTPIGRLAETLDGPAAKILLGAVVEHAYQDLKSRGQIA